ncbi:MAG TPA: MBL fold metallo-hydrolase [Thermoleophilaceae bacterium]|nr:MBL fold metallo-hydrolase [Thermoleophilaceae bacterium]
MTGNHPAGVMRRAGIRRTLASVTTNRITYIGHATLLIELGGARLLTDPVLRGRVAYLVRHGAAPEVPREIDAVLISHMHHDHLDIPSLRLLGGRPRVIAPRGAGSILRRSGLDVEELERDESIEVAGTRVRAVRADHDSGRWPVAGATATPLGFLAGDSPSVYFAGDTDLFPEMEAIGPVDIALLPVAGWGPKLGPGHMDAVRAAQAVAVLRPRIAIPIHWGTIHPTWVKPGAWFSEPGERFEAQVAAVAPEVEVRVLAPGESTAVSA